MSEPDRRSELSGGGRASPVAETLAEDAVQLFENPSAMRVGGVSPRNLSPREMTEVARERRPDQTQDPKMFLTEVPVSAIGKKGLKLLRQTFSGLDLLPLTTGPKHRLRRDLVMRYNRAEAARGVLKELMVLERDAQGVYTVVARLKRSDLFHQEMNNAVFLRERARYVERLRESFRMDARQLLAIETGTTAVEELVNAIEARQRLQQRNRPDPIVSKPRWDDGTRRSVEADADYQAMLVSRPEASESVVPNEVCVVNLLVGLDPLGKPLESAAPRVAPNKARQTQNKRTRAAVKTSRKKSPSSEPSKSAVQADEPDGSSAPIAGSAADPTDFLSSAPWANNTND